jgi:hypothetical protein
MRRKEFTLSSGARVVFEGPIRLRDLREMAEADARGDLEAIARVLSRVIAEWSFPGSPRDPAAFEDLDYFDYLDILDAFRKWLRREEETKA